MQNGVIETATGDLLRCGRTTFVADAGEEVRTDVPEPAYTRREKDAVNMHRWDGTTWTLVPRPPIVVTTFLASSSMIAMPETLNQSTWMPLGGVVTTPDGFGELSELIGRSIGSVKTDGTICLRIVEVGTGAGGSDKVISPDYEVPDTGSVWEEHAFNTNVPPSSGRHTYVIEGKLVGATTAELRFWSLSMLRVVIY